MTRKQSKKGKEAWWRNAFDEKYLNTYIDATTPNRTRKEVAFLNNLFAQRRIKTILDVACGIGRHVLSLSKLGYQVVGIDQSKNFIKTAEEKAASRNLPAVFMMADMREFQLSQQFDAAICMFTSFGYFNRAQDNQKVLTRIALHLRKNGVLILDLNNFFRTLWRIVRLPDACCEKQTLTASEKTHLSNELRVLTEHRLDLSAMRWQMRKTWKQRKKTVSYRTSVQVYLLPELKWMLERSGFEIVAVFGDFTASTYSANSRRMILIARKK